MSRNKHKIVVHTWGGGGGGDVGDQVSLPSKMVSTEFLEGIF